MHYFPSPPLPSLSMQMSQKVMDLAMRSSFYRQRRLQVSILNACFWPLRHHPMPSPSSLPKPLDSFCDEYQKFFNAGGWCSRCCGATYTLYPLVTCVDFNGRDT